MSYDPYGHDRVEHTSAKVAAMDTLRKEAKEHHHNRRGGAAPRATVARANVYICKNCEWTGKEPNIQTWNEAGSTWRDESGQERHTPPHSGSMKKCPECDKVVKTRKEWESDDAWAKWAPRVTFVVLVTMVAVVAVVAMGEAEVKRSKG